ncbi:hypothetical protein [Sphingobacterium yanglingense]|uniref:Uncharacterized protein n=1 Tax=Sphingobacterium yanglingense TaxID=1437280 RepID=A0A4R6WIX5_9SPHI|nr:hypothetical protein [Sphingobacterium yanglingense]TDQ78321.1 hypothetical protein CLV99_2304 [Sphingobacterium yanglingense]
MIKSQLILDIFDLIFEDFEFEERLRHQIPFLKEGKTEHSTIGLFVYFDAERGIEKYKIPTENIETKDINGNAIERIDGVHLKNSELKILADINVHIKAGIIDCVEIWNMINDYPTTEPSKYELEQVWVKSKKRKLIRD